MKLILMMEATKRSGDLESEETVKKARNDTDIGRLEDFLAWCEKGKLTISSKVRIGREGSCAQYGMVATEDIDCGECLFEIPRKLLLTPENCAISTLLKQESEALHSRSGWVKLLVALMHEYTSPTSFWRPYVQLVPDFDELDLPMFWTRNDLETNLKGTGVIEAVDRDIENITEEFSTKVKPFVEKHSEFFSDKCLQLEFYKKMVAFVMSYSFTEPTPGTDNQDSNDEDDDDDDLEDCSVNVPPMMVPVADILNHVAKNNAHLDFGKQSLTMVAVKPIKKGEEVFNTYGHLSNSQLLHMYGFAEPYPENHNDTVDIPMKLVKDSSGLKEDSLEKRWTFLTNMGVVSEDGSFVLGPDGILTEEELAETLKVLCMGGEAFLEYKDQEGWKEDIDEEESMSNEDIPKLPKTWKEILTRVVEHCLANYNSSLDADNKNLAVERVQEMSRRQQFSTHVRYGQMKLLAGLLKLCRTSSDT